MNPEEAVRAYHDIVAAADGSFYFADPLNHSVRRLVGSGSSFMVETVVGNGVPGFIDGAHDVARFNTPTGLAFSPDGSYLYIADTGNNRVRRMQLATGIVETFAGDGSFGGIDGPGYQASFGQPIGLAFGPDGKTQVTVEYEGDRPTRIDTVVVSTQHAPSATANEIRDYVIEKIVKPLPDLRTGHPAVFSRRSLSSTRARWSRDFTVPTGISRMSATSVYFSPW